MKWHRIIRNSVNVNLRQSYDHFIVIWGIICDGKRKKPFGIWKSESMASALPKRQIGKLPISSNDHRRKSTITFGIAKTMAKIKAVDDQKSCPTTTNARFERNSTGRWVDSGSYIIDQSSRIMVDNMALHQTMSESGIHKRTVEAGMDRTPSKSSPRLSNLTRDLDYRMGHNLVLRREEMEPRWSRWVPILLARSPGRTALVQKKNPGRWIRYDLGWFWC